MTIKMSEDNGKSWEKEYQVYAGPSGYSDLVMIDKTKIAILYEGGVKRYTSGLAFEVIDLKDFQTIE